ncbi:MAG TPA: hypothetical protein VJK07_00805 [Candidatus Nanoarchaeia archaeon]|nr:hypothetical protein [Candidatus Nanoarchaeia archaeon]
MSNKILLGTIRKEVGEDIYTGWVAKAQLTYDSGMRDAKHRDLNGQSAIRQPRTSFIQEYVSRQYTGWRDSHPNPHESIGGELEQAALRA